MENGQEKKRRVRTVQMGVKLGPLTLKNPLVLVAGTCGMGDSYASFTLSEELGAVTTPTLTPEPMVGRPQPRMFETHGGVLHATGGENPGVESFVLHDLPRLKQYKMTVIASVGGNSVEDFCRVASVLSTSDVDAIELNTNCLCRERGHVFGAAPDTIASLCSAVVAVARKPVIVKLAPRVTDLGLCANAAEESGAQILSLVASFPAMLLDPYTGRSVLNAGTGRLSGAAIFPQALHAVYEVRRATKLPIIGMGGVSNVSEALQMMMVGANAVGIGSAMFADPGLPDTIKQGMQAFCQEKGIRQLSKITDSYIEQ